MKIFIEVYQGIEITQNPKSGNFYLISPVTHTQRIFDSLERAHYYIDHADVLDSHLVAMGRG